jgi:GntR family phosphonate transport system transcriptional regulator
METTVNRAAGIALWRQIADRLRAEIVAGTWPGGSALPTESALASRFRVNRHTVRRALATLAGEGLVRTDQGRGTFALARRLSYPIGRRTRFSEIISRQAKEPGGRLIANSIAPADLTLAETLGVPKGTPLVRLETLSVADAVPISMASSWFSAERFPRLVALYAETGSITAALAGHGVDDYLRRSTRIRARGAEPSECERLDLPAGAIVLVTDSLNEGADGTPVHFSSTSFAADRIEIAVEPEDP